MGSAKSKIAGMASGLILPKKPAVKSVPAEKLEEAAEPAKPRGSKRREEPGERLAIYVPPELATKLRVYCAQSRSSLSDAITRALEKMLS